MKQKEQDILGGVINPEPETNKMYKARNGLYYNGYIHSDDCAQDAFGEAFKKTADLLEKELLNDSLWNKDGTKK